MQKIGNCTQINLKFPKTHQMQMMTFEHKQKGHEQWLGYIKNGRKQLKICIMDGQNRNKLTIAATKQRRISATQPAA